MAFLPHVGSKTVPPSPESASGCLPGPSRRAPTWPNMAQNAPKTTHLGPNLAPRCPNIGQRRAQDGPKMGPSTDAAGPWQPCWPRHGSPDLQEYRQDHNQTSKQPCWHAFLTFLPRQIIKKHWFFNCCLKLLACGLLATCEL